jgi:hypothetical protein
MAAEPLAAELVGTAAPDVTGLPPAERLKILLAAAAVMLLLQFAAPGAGFIGLPILFFLKNRLHLTAQGLAGFNFWAGAPLYLSFVFGVMRDRWSPAGRGDRGHLVLFGVVTAVLYLALAFLPPSYPVLLVGCLLVTAGVQAAWSATQGLSSQIAQEHAISGQTSTTISLAGLVPGIIAFVAGGFLSSLLELQGVVIAARLLFLAGAALMLGVAVFGALGPRQLFDAAKIEKPRTSLAEDVGRLLRCTPIYAPLIIQLLWQFGPAGGAALQYHLANHLHASDSDVGLWYAVFWASILPSMAAYGWLCQRVRLRTLLWWGAIMAVPQWAPLLFVHNMSQAFIAAVPIGLVAGIAQVAFTDITVRACPPRLQGTMMMLLWSMYWIAIRGGDVWGAWLYETQGGLTTAIWATIGVYALIVPMLLFIPRRLTDTMDGEAVAVSA